MAAPPPLPPSISPNAPPPVPHSPSLPSHPRHPFPLLPTRNPILPIFSHLRTRSLHLTRPHLPPPLQPSRHSWFPLPVGFPLKLCPAFIHDVSPPATAQLIQWLRSTAIFVSLFFIFGVRAAAGSQQHNSVLPVLACVSSQKENKGVRGYIQCNGLPKSDVSSDADSSISASHDESHIPTSSLDSDNNVSSTVHPRSWDSTSHQDVDVRASHRNNDESGSGTENEVDNTGVSSDQQGLEDEVSAEDLEDDEDDYDEFEDIFVDDNEQSGQSVQLQGHAEDTEEVLQNWSSTPYKLTVPLRIVSLRGSLPPTWIKDFRLCQGKRVRTTFEYRGSLQEIISALSDGIDKKKVKPQSILAADVVTIGDSWLQVAISKGLIEAIDNADQYDWFKRLNSKWQAYMRRDQEGRISNQGLIWGVPYRWGSMVVAFRKDKLSNINMSDIEDWKDLWRPELTGKIAMVDSPREVVGAVLKSLGASYNVQDFEKDVAGGKEAVKQQFIAFQKQVKLFDSTHYLKALASGDVWVAVGWCSDVIPMAKRMSNMRVIAPNSGTSLWADVWAIPAATAVPTDRIGSRVYRASPLVHQWFDFCLQSARASPFRQGVYTGASPLYYPNEKGQVDHNDVEDGNMITNDNMSSGGPNFDTNLIDGMPPRSSLEKSEFLEPLTDKAISDYEWLFAQVKEHNSQRRLRKS